MNKGSGNIINETNYKFIIHVKRLVFRKVIEKERQVSRMSKGKEERKN